MNTLRQKTAVNNLPSSTEFTVFVENITLQISESIEDALLSNVAFDALENSANLKLSAELENITSKQEFFFYLVTEAIEYFHSLDEIGVVNVIADGDGSIKNIVIAPVLKVKKTAH